MPFDVQAVIAQCNGMLAPEAYAAMYEAAKTAPETTFVEVGTAHAAGTVCLAMGLRDSGRTGTVYSFEKIIGGSREAYGSVNKNIEIINQNIAHFGLTEFVNLIIGDVRDLAGEVPTDTPLGLLCLDADGAIDRDFALFFDKLAPDAPIIIDDVQNMTRIKRVGRKRLSAIYKIDMKHRLSYRLVDLFKEKGLLGAGKSHGYGTWVGVRGTGQMCDVSAEEIVDVYRSLTFTEAAVSMIPMREKLAATIGPLIPSALLDRLKSMEK